MASFTLIRFDRFDSRGLAIGRRPRPGTFRSPLSGLRSRKIYFDRFDSHSATAPKMASSTLIRFDRFDSRGLAIGRRPRPGTFRSPLSGLRSRKIYFDRFDPSETPFPHFLPSSFRPRPKWPPLP
jgi:hypothetical protein